MLGALPDPEPDRRADPLDEQRRRDEDAGCEERLRRPILGDRFRDRWREHRAEEQPCEESRDREGDAAQASAQAREGDQDQEQDDDDVEDVHLQQSLLARGDFGVCVADGVGAASRSRCGQGC